MYRNIIALLGDRLAFSDSNVLDVAINIAKRSDGHILGAYVLPFTSAMFSTSNVADVESLHNKTEVMHEKFESKIRAADVNGDWCNTQRGDAVAEVARQSLYADLIIFSRVEIHQSTVDKVLLTACCPMLMLPPSNISDGSFDNVLVAWKGTREAARALHDALPILHKANDVLIVIFGESNNDEKQSMISYLAVHGINARVEEQSQESFLAEHGMQGDSDKSIGHRLLTLSKDEERDLIVMGAYGHTRLSESVLSGVTHTVTRSAEMPVLMSH